MNTLLRSILVAIACLPGSVVSAEGHWYLVEFAASKPPCESAEDTRCRGTRPEVTAFEIRDGEEILLPDSGGVPASWLRLRRLWVHAPSVADSDFYLTLDRTPIGARIQLRDGATTLLDSLPLGQWQRLEASNGRQLWGRVRALQADAAASSDSSSS